MRKSKLLILFVTLIFIFIIFPLFITTVASFNSGSRLTFPIEGFSFKWYLNSYKPSYIEGFFNSLKIGVLATIISLLFGVPVAYGLAKFDDKVTRRLKMFFFSPVLIPAVVLSYAIFILYIAELQLPKFTILLLAHIIVLFPYTIRVVGGAFENFDFTIEDAAISLGATKIGFVIKVLLPTITPAIVSASILCFITSFNNVPISIFLYGRGATPLPIMMMEYVEYYGDPTVASMSVVLMIVTLGIAFLIEKTMGLDNYGK